MDLKDFINNINLYTQQVHAGPTHTPRHAQIQNPATPLQGEWSVWAGLRTTPLLFKRMSTERPIESGCILHQRKCRPLPEPPVSPWSIPALVPAACATSHMIPTVPPLFRKSDSCEWRERGLRSNPLPPKRGDNQNVIYYRPQSATAEPPLPPASPFTRITRPIAAQQPLQAQR